jgi:hypothetical protein
MSNDTLALPHSTLLPDFCNAVEIDWYDENDKVVVRPRNEQRFSIQKDRAIEVLRMVKETDRFNMQFNLLLGNLGKWIRDRAESIRAAIVTLQDNSLVLVVVQSGASYDEQFQEDLSDLDFRVAQDADLDLIKLRTVLLPPVEGDALGSFLDQRMILTYKHHGK